MSVDGAVESGESLQFRTETLGRTENGIELGRYRAIIEGFMAELLPYYFENDLSLVQREVEKAAKEEWEAVVIALNGDYVVGFGSLDRIKEGDMSFSYAYVTPEHRNRGIYTRLLESRLALAKQKGANSVTIQPMESNVAQDGYITRHGFHTTPNPEFENGVYYKKDLR